MNADNYTIGCIGCGNMGSAILNGLAATASCKLMGFDLHEQLLAPLREKGIGTAKNIQKLAAQSDIIIIALKPWYVTEVLSELQNSLTNQKVILSVAAGISMQELQKSINHLCPVIRCMPNTPAIVGSGVYAFCFEDVKLSPKMKEDIFALFQNIGTCLELAEKHFVAFTALIGSGPAYVFHFMNALVQTGVTMGFTRSESKRLVEALVAGSVQMAQASPHNLTELRDQVCSPAGVAIEGINYLEEYGISGHTVQAISKAWKRAKAMEK